MGNTGNNKLRNQVEQELQATIERLVDLNAQLDYYKQRAFDPPSLFGKRLPPPPPAGTLRICRCNYHPRERLSSRTPITPSL